MKLENYTTSGTIDALNEMVELDCPGSASAVITVTGTFNGTLSVTGSGDPISANGVQGGRLVFKSGVGSLGDNKITSDGQQAITHEYRIFTGGKSVRVEATAWTSGSCKVEITSSENPSIIFINGPVHGSFEEAVRAGRAFSAGTGTQDVTTGDFVKCTFENPIDSGVNAFVVLRRFSNNRKGNETLLQAGLVTTFTDITSPVSVTPNNLKTGGASSVIEFNYKVENSALGTAVLETPLPLNGIPAEIEIVRLVQPGEKFGYQVEGIGGGGLGSAAKTALAFVWFEEEVN